jgi:hypothetical protein
LPETWSFDRDLDTEPAKGHGILAGQVVDHPEACCNLIADSLEGLWHRALQPAVERLDNMDNPWVDLGGQMPGSVSGPYVDGTIVAGAWDKHGVVFEAVSVPFGRGKEPNEW